MSAPLRPNPSIGRTRRASRGEPLMSNVRPHTIFLRLHSDTSRNPMFRKLAISTAFAIGLVASAVPSTCLAQRGKGSDQLVGAWRGQVQFTSGAFADTKDL